MSSEEDDEEEEEEDSDIFGESDKEEDGEGMVSVFKEVSALFVFCQCLKWTQKAIAYPLMSMPGFSRPVLLC